MLKWRNNRASAIADWFGGGLSVLAMAMAFSVQGQEGSEGVKEGVLEAMAKPTKVILFSLNPNRLSDGGALTDGMVFHGYHELGEAALDEVQTGKALAAVMPSITGWEDRGDRCMFEPRHALRIVGQGHTYDILLCYHCGDLAVFDGANEVAYRPLLGKGDVLNDLLKETKVPAVKQPTDLPRDAEDVMRAPDSAVVYALGALDQASSNRAVLHGYPILRERALDKGGARQVGSAMNIALSAWDGSFLNCEFRPTQGVRLSQKGATFDLLFGYDCKQVVAYQGDKEVACPGLALVPELPDYLPVVVEYYLTNGAAEGASASH